MLETNQLARVVYVAETQHLFPKHVRLRDYLEQRGSA
jgi:hypothetical protein